MLPQPYVRAMSEFSLRPAMRGDATLILGLQRELADYEKLSHEFQATEETVQRDLLGPDAVCRCDLAFASDRPAGLATWYWTYRTFRARRGLYLEDLYVSPQFRGRGLGRQLLRHLAAKALAADAGFFDWQVLDWNASAITFYKSLGAAQTPDWLNYRLQGAALKELAES
jgi:GNAT superfamily N-acetyltransferase